MAPPLPLHEGNVYPQDALSVTGAQITPYECTLPPENTACNPVGAAAEKIS